MCKPCRPTQVGKIAEEFIIDWLSNRDKRTYVARFADTYDANVGRWGTNQKKVVLPRKPSDIMLIMNGVTYFCEIKTSTNPKKISAGLFSTQRAERTRIEKAGGNYAYLIYSTVKEGWYFVPSLDLEENSLWEQLDVFYVDFPKVPL